MTGKSERVITNACVSVLRDAGWWVLKIHGGPYQRAGVPDVLAIRNGVAWWFEIKRPGLEPTKLQRHVMDELRAAGCPVHVVTSAAEMWDIVKRDRC